MPIVARNTPMMRRRVQNYRGRGFGAISLPAGYGAKTGISSSPSAVTYASAPGCNVVNLANNQCMLDDGTITGCNIIQECAALTNQQRCQNLLPGETADPSLPFCSGTGGPSISYTPNPNLATPTGPSTPFTPTQLAPNAVPVGSTPTATQVASLLGQPAPAANPIPITNGTPATTGNGTAVIQSNAPAASYALPASTAGPTVDMSGDWISGIPNWLLIGGGILVGGLLLLGGRK